jgi:IQ calmodulin-binding motif
VFVKSMQARFRGNQVRSVLFFKHSCANTIQRSWSRYQGLLQSRLIALSGKSATTIQSHWRSNRARIHLRRCIIAAIAIQALWRKVETRIVYSKLLHATCFLQAAVRGILCRMRNMAWEKAARSIQIAWARFTVSKFEKINVLVQTASATTIQATWRASLAQNRFRQLKVAMVMIQRNWRCYYAHEQFSRKLLLAISFQTAYRGLLVRRLIDKMNRSASIIQFRWKRYRKRNIENQKLMIVLIQTHWRSVYMKKQLRFHRAATKIQQTIRARSSRLAYAKCCRSATILESVFRLYMSRRRFLVVRGAVQKIQRAWRCRVALRAVQFIRSRRKNAAEKMQRFFITLRMAHMITKLESATYLLRRSLFEKFSRTTAVYALLVINMVFRSSITSKFLCLDKIGSLSYLSTMNKWKYQKSVAMELAAVLIQCFCRGSLCRMELKLPQNVGKKMFSIVPFVRRDKWTETIRESTVADGFDTKCEYESRVEARAINILLEQAELLSSFAVGLLLSDVGCLMRQVHDLLDSPCLQRLAARVINTRSSIAAFLPKKEGDLTVESYESE